ncbi:MAG: D-aminoacyl-tRNA deacylase [Candidatus Amulumruptor caecigallinarius]|nr:D-aminoacyl-tRNA deacylase [Candidatus Amulumruptor caecigallinarius]MCM1396578.1 D-aminoacyl-tRNA deacylase [Candidatus Amulumruptor caecigallinarius]MCM1453364.1 D-aminoacyl-tRNA deacylase [bacterium]
MKIVIQRVKEASVTIGGRVHSRIGEGLMVLVGVERDDTPDCARWLAAKTAGLRIFDDEAGVMNRSVADVGGQVLAVSQFTLLADARHGNRPSYIRAAGHDLAVPLYELYCAEVERLLGRKVHTGVFGAMMDVALVNSGPVTIVIEKKIEHSTSTQ